MSSGISIVCREVSRQTGAIATYVCKKDAEDRDLQLIDLCSRVNPELQYYAIRTCVANNTEMLEDLLRFLKRRNLSEAAIKRYGEIVQL